MPRAKVKAPGVRADGEVMAGNTTPAGSGQPNGREPHSRLAQAAAAGAGERPSYGEAKALHDAIANTPVPPGVHPVAHAARIAAQRAGLVNHQGQLSHPNVTPLFAPTERPWEPVTAGAPLAPGPTNPMAQPMPGSPGMTVASILEQAAQASGSPVLQALAARAQAVSAPTAAPLAA
jgi:hypothetical protein